MKQILGSIYPQNRVRDYVLGAWYEYAPSPTPGVISDEVLESVRRHTRYVDTILRVSDFVRTPLFNGVIDNGVLSGR